MELVHIWVDLSNFNLFLAGKPFFGWSDQSTDETIQVGALRQRVKSIKDYPEGIMIEFK